MPSALIQMVLLVSAYSPLVLVYALLGTFGGRAVTLALVTVALLSWAGLAVFLATSRRLGVTSLEVSGNRPRDADAVGYVVAYLLPFLMNPEPSREEIIATTLFLVLIAILYLRSHLFYVNPILSLLGYRLFEIDVGDGTYMLISKHRALRVRGRITVHRVSDYVYLEAEDR